jgi:hypothetical protein
VLISPLKGSKTCYEFKSYVSENTKTEYYAENTRRHNDLTPGIFAGLFLECLLEFLMFWICVMLVESCSL